MSPDDTPTRYGADGIFSGLHEKGPGVGPGPASLSGWECVHRSGGGGSEFLDYDLLFCAEPIFLVVTVFPAACLIELVRS